MTYDCGTGSGGRAHAVNATPIMTILRAEFIAASPESPQSYPEIVGSAINSDVIQE